MEQQIDLLVSATQQTEKERVVVEVLDIISQHLISWPASADSQLWNKRVMDVVDHILNKFDMNGENK
jgi:hypothetical protein